MRAYRKTATKHPFAVYLTDSERDALLKELEASRVTFASSPSLFKLAAHLTRPREDNGRG